MYSTAESQSTVHCPLFLNRQPKQAETLARKEHVGKNVNRLAGYTFCCFAKQSKHCCSCRKLAVKQQQQRRRKCPLTGHTNNRPSLLSITEDLAKFDHSYRRSLPSHLLCSCRSAPSVLKGLKIESRTNHF